MIIDFDNEAPIYVQIARAIEDDILKGVFKEEDMIPSTTEISTRYKINPATVAKGFNMLVDEGVIYKKRGVGMFVSKGSKEILIGKRKDSFFNDYVITLMEEAEKLNISKKDIINMIEER